MDVAAETIDDVEKAAAWLEAAAKGDKPLLHSIAALHVLRNRAVADPMMAEHAAALAPRMERAAFEAAPVLAADLAGLVLADQIYVGLGSLAALVAQPDDVFRVDRLLHIGRLGGKLTAELHERALKERGDPLSRAIAIRLAADALPAGMVQ